MIRSRVILNTRPLDNLDVGIRNYENQAFKAAEAEYNAIKSELESAMRFYPPKPLRSRYKRTYRLKRGLKTRLIRRGDRIDIVAESEAPYSKWVIGTFDQRRKYQSAVHKRNGWPLVATTVQRYQDRFRTGYRQRMSKVFGASPSAFGARIQNR